MIIVDYITTFVVWGVLLPFHYLLGSFIGKFLDEEDPMWRGFYYFAFGLAFFVFYLILIGSSGFYQIGPVIAFVLAVFCVRFRLLREFRTWFSNLLSYVFKGRSLYLTILLVAGLLVTLGASLLPEVANDALCHQLNVPKNFVRAGSIIPNMNDLNSFMSMQMNLLYGVGLMLDNIGVAKFFHWFCGFFVVCAIIRLVDKETGNKNLAVLVATAFILTPTVFNEISSTYVDVGLTFYVFLFFQLLLKSLESGKKTSFFLSGLLLGFAVAIKFYVLILGFAIGVILINHFFHSSKKMEFLRGIGLLLFGATIGCAYWLTRNWVLTSNPFFPFLGNLLDMSPQKSFGSYWENGFPKTFTNFLLLPWNMVFRPHPFDVHHWVGPFYLAVLPFACLSLVSIKKARPYFILLFFYTFAWFFVGQTTRYLMPMFPIYLVGSALGISKSERVLFSEPMKKIANWIGLAILFGLLLVGVYHYRFQYMPLFGLWDQGIYLGNMERSYPIADWMNRNLPENVKILNAEEIRQFYVDRDFNRESVLYLNSQYSDGKTSAEIISLLKELNYTHVLRTYTIDADLAEEPRLVKLDEGLQMSRLAKLRLSIESQNIREPRSVYKLYELR
jgi:hypothetical protein